MTLVLFIEQLLDNFSDDLFSLNEAGIIPVKKLNGVLSFLKTGLENLKNRVQQQPQLQQQHLAGLFPPAEMNNSPYPCSRNEPGPHDQLLFKTLATLIHICDILFDLSLIIMPEVNIITAQLYTIKQILPIEIWPGLRLPKSFIALKRESINATLKRQQEIMITHSISEKLIEIAAIPFLRFINSKQGLCWGDFTWLKDYIAKLDIVDWEDADCNTPEEALLSLLIGRDFNDDRFYIYCKKYIQARTRKIAGKRHKLLEFAQCQKLVLQDTQIGVLPFDTHANTVSTRLLKWIGEEIDFVETHERDIPLAKFPFQWNVETIAFFFKLLWDHKVFGKVSLEPLSEQIAANCSSVGKDEFQATTIFSRFYVKDREVLAEVERVLNDMLGDVRRFL